MNVNSFRKNKKHTADKEIFADSSSDEGPPSPTEDRRLSWRMDPSESLSDWTIEIVSTRKELTGKVLHVDFYHVHKCHLAAGSRKSGYFVTLFGNSFSESTDRKSRIELHELAAKVFPDLLDYLYHLGPNMPFTTENATALYYMAKYFDMDRLRWDAKQFWKRDLERVGACGTYLEHAYLLQVDKILQPANRACMANIMSMDTTSRLVHVPDSSFWLKLLASDRPMQEKMTKDRDSDSDFSDSSSSDEATVVSQSVFSCHVSVLIAEFVKHVPVDTPTFQKLTSKKSLPSIHYQAALPLMDSERAVVAPDDSVLTCLQGRCINAIAANWEDFDPEDMLVSQNKLVLSELVVRGFAAARREKESVALGKVAARKRKYGKLLY
jgi:hypothetical protein